MATVKLTPIKGDGKEKSFDLAHAQNIFDHIAKNPPASWKLTDDKYVLKNGKIEPKSSTKSNNQS